MDQTGMSVACHCPWTLSKGLTVGCMELELGEFYNKEEGNDGEVCIRPSETTELHKKGLIVYGIVIRPKK